MAALFATAVAKFEVLIAVADFGFPSPTRLARSASNLVATTDDFIIPKM